MRAAEMADIHKAAFERQRPWSKTEFQILRGQTNIRIAAQQGGFGILRLLPGEAEILTLAVRPENQNKGLGRALVGDLLQKADGAAQVFLEVAESNRAARALYAACGFTEKGRRPNYYRYPDGGRDDALTMSLHLDQSGAQKPSA